MFIKKASVVAIAALFVTGQSFAQAQPAAAGGAGAGAATSAAVGGVTAGMVAASVAVVAAAAALSSGSSDAASPSSPSGALKGVTDNSSDTKVSEATALTSPVDAAKNVDISTDTAAKSADAAASTANTAGNAVTRTDGVAAAETKVGTALTALQAATLAAETAKNNSTAAGSPAAGLVGCAGTTCTNEEKRALAYEAARTAKLRVEAMATYVAALGDLYDAIKNAPVAANGSSATKDSTLEAFRIAYNKAVADVATAAADANILIRAYAATAGATGTVINAVSSTGTTGSIGTR